MTAPVAADLLAAGEWESALLIGLAQIIAAGIPDWTYDDDTQGAVQIAVGGAPDTPDRICVIDSYADGWQDPTTPVGELLVQFRFRSRRDTPLDVKGMSSRLFTLLHGATDLTVGGIHCPTIYRDTHANLGRDSTRRWERTDNYSVTVDLPSSTYRQ